MLTKRSYKVRVLTQPIPSTPTLTAPAPRVATVSSQIPLVRSSAESILVIVYKLTTGKFAEVPCPTTIPRMKDPTLHHWKIYPIPQSDRVPLGLAQGQLLRTYLKQEKTGNSPTPTPTSTPTVKTEAPK